MCFIAHKSTASLSERRGPRVPPSSLMSLSLSFSQGEPVWGPRALGGGPLQRWQQALLRQVSLQGVEDVELLIHAEGQELLDHLGGVWAPERRENISVHPQSKTTSTELNYCYNTRGNRQLAPRELPPPNTLDTRHGLHRESASDVFSTRGSLVSQRHKLSLSSMQLSAPAP